MLSLFPVVVLVISLIFIDTFKLVKKEFIMYLFISGALISLLAYLINTLSSEIVQNYSISRWGIIPLTEEVLKFTIVIYIYQKKKIAFMIDAIIYGFTIGSGFALIENMYYYYFLDINALHISIIRGFGTAVMHGFTTGIASVLLLYFNHLKEIKISKSIMISISIVVIIHAFYNFFNMQPMIQTSLVLFSFIITTYFIFENNEKTIRKWIDEEFDTEIDLLNMIESGQFGKTKTGKYINDIKSRYDPLIMVDMIMLIKLNLELSLQSKAALMIQSNDINVPFDTEIQQKIIEYNQLLQNIGKLNLKTLSPVLRLDRSAIWKINMLNNSSNATNLKEE